MRIDHADFAGLLAVASRLRQADFLELAVTRDPTDHLRLCLDAWKSTLCYLARDSHPVFAFGAKVINAETAHIWGFGTEEAPQAILCVTKFTKRDMVPRLLSYGLRDAQCVVHPENALSRRWLEFLGFRPEATISDLGAEHQRLILYRVILADVFPRKSRRNPPASHPEEPARRVDRAGSLV